MRSAQERAAIEDYIERYGKYLGDRRLRLVEESKKFVIEKTADGAYISDTSGRRYLDFFLATGVFNLGHRNPVLLGALRDALEEEDYGGVFYFSEAKGALARDLIESLEGKLDVVLPAVGGGEANDLAMKMAMAATGRQEFVCFEGAYHGSTGLTAALGPPMLREWFPLELVKVHRVPVGDLVALDATLSSNPVAACLFEPIRSLVDGKNAGPEYWTQVRKLCDRHGSKLIVDEVVCGLGRLGTLWGSQMQGIQPDMLVSAKGLSGGLYPMAAVALKADLLECWGDNAFRSYSTYAWSNIGARVAVAVLAETRRILPQANCRADALEHALDELRVRHPDLVRDVRRTGLHFVLETFPERMSGRELTLRMMERGVLLQASGAYPDAPAKLFPPLILESGHITELAEKLDDVFSGR